MEIEVKARATGARKLFMRFKGPRDAVDAVHGYRFDEPVDVFVDGVLTPIPDPPLPAVPPPSRQDIYEAVMMEAFDIGGDAEVEAIWDALDAVPSFGQALDAMDYGLARKRAPKLKSKGKLSQEQLDRLLAHVPAA